MRPRAWTHIGFVYHGTAENGFDLDLLTSFCESIPEQNPNELQKQLDNELARGKSFTYTIRGDYHPMRSRHFRWTGEDDCGRFQISDAIAGMTPYIRYKYATLSKKGIPYHFHIYYHDLDTVVNDMELSHMGSRLGIMEKDQKIILVRSVVNAMLLAASGGRDTAEVMARVEALRTTAMSPIIQRFTDAIAGKTSTALDELMEENDCELDALFFDTAEHRSAARSHA